MKKTLTLNKRHSAHAHPKRKNNNRRNTGCGPRTGGARQFRRFALGLPPGQAVPQMARNWSDDRHQQKNSREAGKSPAQPPLNCKTETFTQENAVVRASHHLPNSQTLQPPDAAWRKVNDPSHLVQPAIQGRLTEWTSGL